MLPCNPHKVNRPVKTTKNAYSEEHVRTRIPSIRKKILYLIKLSKQKDITIDNRCKINDKIAVLRKERLNIINHLPTSLQALYQIHELNILGFENCLNSTCKTIFLTKKPIDLIHIAPSKCQSLTMKGNPCTRKGSSKCGKFCKIHDPALVQVRKINSL